MGAPRGLPTPPSGRLLLVDAWNGTGKLRADELAAAGVAGVIAKATDGTRAVDGQWGATSKAVLDDGRLLLSAYGVLEPGAPPVPQAKHFAETIRDVYAEDQLGALVFCPWLDWELAARQTGAQAVRCARAWVEAAEDALGRRVGVYSYRDFLLEIAKLAGSAGEADLAALRERPAWLAHYTQGHETPPKVPPPWDGLYLPGDEASPRPLLWQASGGRKVSRNYATVPWADVDVCVDLFDGTAEQLFALGSE